MNNDSAGHSTDSDSLLLENLFQFALRGDTHGPDFTQINDTVYQRLQQTYGVTSSPEQERNAA